MRIDDDTNMFRRHLNLMLYGAPPSEEVKATDAWDYLTINNPHLATERYYRRGEKARVHKNHVTVRKDTYEWIPDVEAIAELRALMEKWRQTGRAADADLVETRTEDLGDGETETSSIYDALGTSKTHSTYVRIPIENVTFYRELPYHANGLQKMIEEPRKFSRIVGLDTAPTDAD